MFSLRERTKIRLCRAAFVLACLLPTALTLGWAVAIRLPGYRLAHQQAIANRLGVQARLGAVHLPRPGTVLYESVELRDPESGQMLARLPFVELEVSGTSIGIQLPYPATINGRCTDLAWRLLQDHSRGHADWPPLSFEAENVTLNLPGGDQTLTGFRGSIDADESQWKLSLDFRRALAGQSDKAQTSFSLVRRRDAGRSTSVLQLVTGTTPLPCALAEPVWPELAHLGKGSEFLGRIVATHTPGGWQTQLTGQVSKIDLDRLIGQQFAHGMTGLASVQFEELAIDNGRIAQARGRVRAVDGSLSRGLVHSAASNLHLKVAPETLRLERPLAYKHLDVSFAISVQGLLLQGDATGVRGAILIDTAGRVVLVEPAMPSQPVVNLARALVPQGEWLVPAAREVAGLVRALPMPPLAPSDGQRQPAVQARIVGPKLR